MFKRLMPILLTIILLISSIAPAYADSSDIYNLSSGSTSQFLVSIFRPEGDESVFKSSYVISGGTSEEGIIVKLLRVDDNGYLVPFYDNQGEWQWEVGAAGFFMREVVLPKEGANKIRVVAYKKSEAESLAKGYNLQINDFTIMVFSQSLKDSFMNGRFDPTRLAPIGMFY